ncbi:MAG TPA: penicillin-binding protein 2, partial [Sporolactobacillaceae bacterium]|nr:penicillin-binding protein 2 [Sporolactobacillaceae bacterium]
MEEQNLKKKKKNHIPFRLNVLFLIIFLAFSALILRLGVVQIVDGDKYAHALQETNHVKTKVDSARGLILDRNGTLLVSNKAEQAIIFTRKPDLDTNDLLDIAKKLNKYILVSTDKKVPDGALSTAQVTDRDKKDYWIATHPDIYQEKLSKKELSGDSKKAYKLLLSRITDKELSQISENELKVIAIWRQLTQASNLTPAYVKIGLTDKELAEVGEHLKDFKGTIDTAVAATREYPQGQMFFLGNVKEIPKHEVNNYLADGYNRNDLVGTSNLEQQYEDILRGVPTTLTFTTKNGKPVGNPQKTEGRRGEDLMLTIDSRLQKQVGDVLTRNIQKFHSSHTNSAYAVIMNPHTGGILAMVGRKYDPSTGKVVDDSSGTILNAFQIGSSVKGATILTGYQNHAVPGQFNDKPIKYAGGKGSFSSLEDIPTVGPSEALEYSSNVYMAKIASNMAGFQITDEGSSYLARLFYGQHFVNAFKALRDGYSEFGLGVHTGIDLPFESVGYEGPIPVSEPGKIMQFAIGQYDTYTPIEMAQYVSTIANGGHRLAPHLLKSVHEPSGNPDQIGPTVQTFEPKVLNTIPNTQEQIDTVHKGFYLVTQGDHGTARMLGYMSPGHYAKYKIAGKTGTAQLAPVERGIDNLAFIGYAPYDNPQVAV